MMRRAALVFVCLGFMLLPRLAAADPFLSVTGCDTATVNGQQLMRLTFSVHNASQNVAIFGITGEPLTYQSVGDTCRALELRQPAGWSPIALGDQGPGWGTTCCPIVPGATLGGFSLVLRRPTCCYEWVFRDVFMDIAGIEDVCWACPLATPAGAPSWGRLKVLYR